MTKQYNLENIRALLAEGFSTEKLRCFCYDEFSFRPVYNKFTQDTDKATIINWLLQYAGSKLQIEVLLTWAREHNPAAYEKHQPYDDITTSPSTSSGVHGKSHRAKQSNAFVYNAPVAPHHFIGRTAEVDRILSQLANPARVSSAISGDPRVGKTSLLHYLPDGQVCQAWGLAPNWCHFLYLDCHSITPFSEAAFWRYTLRELSRYLNGDQALSQSVQRLLAQPQPDIYDLNSLFDDVARAGRLVVLLLDEFEGAVEHLDRQSPELLYHLRALLNRPERGLALVIASRQSLKQLCAGFRFAGSPFDNSFAALTLAPFSAAEVDELLRQYQANFSPAERAYLGQLAGAHPYLVQLTASRLLEARASSITADLPVPLETDLEREAEGYFSDLFGYSGEFEQMLLAWLALIPLSHHLPVERAGLGDLDAFFGRYEHELGRLGKRGLVLDQPEGPGLFSPIFGRWVLRQVIATGGREVLARWEPYYANFLAPDQTQRLADLVAQVMSRPAIIKTPELLAHMSVQDATASPPIEASREVMGRYIIEGPIGGGGIADVFRARDPNLGRLVALKKLRPTLSNVEEEQARFRREAQAIAALRHPHIVQIHDFDFYNGHYYMVMEFIQGANLQERLHHLQLAGQTLPWVEVLRITTHIAEALDYAHQHDMIHRDVKPSNILLTDEGGVYLADFGLVRLLGQVDVTQTGDIVGTLAYMAPEQMLGQNERIDHRADIYSLGCVVYEMITGQPPFKPTDFPLAHLNMDPPAPKLIIPDLPDLASRIILQALAKEPAERPPRASQFIQDLHQALK